MRLSYEVIRVTRHVNKEDPSEILVVLDVQFTNDQGVRYRSRVPVTDDPADIHGRIMAHAPFWYFEKVRRVEEKLAAGPPTATGRHIGLKGVVG